jgi:hypothetical protein
MPQPQRQTNKSANRIHRLFWTESSGSNCEFIPSLYVEARIDFNDVRTGFRETVSLNKVLDLFNDAGLLWTDDMLREVDSEKISLVVPDGVQIKDLPDFVNEEFIYQMERQFTQYLMRRFEAKVYRNSVLNIYSLPGETRNQFTSRCLELLDGALREELGFLLELFNRKLGQIKQKYLSCEDNSCESEIADEDSRNRDIYSRVADRIAGLFLRPELSSRPAAGLFRSLQGAELEDCLLSLELEAEKELANLWDVYVEKAQAVDEYILHPNLKDIHLVRSCILWLPKQ